MAHFGVGAPARVFNEAQQADIAAMIYVSVGKSNNETDLPSFRPTGFVRGGAQYSQYREDRIESTSHVHEDTASKAARKLPVRLEVDPSRVAQLLSLEALPCGRVGFQELIVTVLSSTSYKVMSAFFNKNMPEFRLDFIIPTGVRDYEFYIRRYKHNDGQKTRTHVKADMLGPYREPIMWEEYECSVQGQPGSIFGDTWTPWDSCARGKAQAGATPDNQRPDDIFIQMLNRDFIWNLVRTGTGTIQENDEGFFVIFEYR